MKYPRGICKVCGKDVRVKRDGTLQGHGKVWPYDDWCSGSWEKGWKLPVEQDARPASS